MVEDEDALLLTPPDALEPSRTLRAFEVGELGGSSEGLVDCSDAGALLSSSGTTEVVDMVVRWRAVKGKREREETRRGGRCCQQVESKTKSCEEPEESLNCFEKYPDTR